MPSRVLMGHSFNHSRGHASALPEQNTKIQKLPYLGFATMSTQDAPPQALAWWLKLSGFLVLKYFRLEFFLGSPLGSLTPVLGLTSPKASPQVHV